MSNAAAIAHARLKRALVSSAEQQGLVITMPDDYSTPWSSNTFDGGRHVLQLQGKSGRPLLDWITALDEDSVSLPGFTIAGLEVDCIVCQSGTTTAYVKAITVQDG